ncbi:(Fe-S)-binding protein [Aquabacterium sp. A7-Y]|uniref:(Fe-S)-binding protein n=1 Tax=Aquabacterium sp. A7-Y TaxID=1349605 RepID=UPI00223E0FD4|nr:(Fe-S)-binding protein [Aquabacterium sp. A7-Y]MCW7541485.1 (Fe-S)-binding protein [Aquabacterium sp. A7-Y]
MSVGFFITCLVDLMRPSIGFAALRLIESAGFDVEVPMAQTCCGQPAYNSGDRATARALAARLLDQFAQFDYIVMPSGSCGGMVREHYADLFRDDPDLAFRFEQLRPKVYELTDFLVNVARLEQVPGRYDGELTYHDSCAGLRELGIKQQPRALLQLTGATLKEMEHCEQCCGFGGTFAVKYGEISGAIADEKCEHIAASGAPAVVLGDLGCMLNIEGRLRRRGDARTRVIHIAEVLAGES